MSKMKVGTLKTRSIEMKSRLRYGAVFPKLLYKSILGKGTQGNRPLFPDVVVDLFLCYNNWTIASESVDELTGIRNNKKIHTSLTINITMFKPLNCNIKVPVVKRNTDDAIFLLNLCADPIVVYHAS